MKKNPIKSGLRETMAGKVTFLFLLFLYTGVMLYLFWMECYQVPGFQSDMPDYVNKVAGIAGNYEFPYPILFWTARLSAWLIGAKAAMAITTALFNLAAVVITKYYMNREIRKVSHYDDLTQGRQAMTDILVTLLVFSLFLLSNLYSPKNTAFFGFDYAYRCMGIYTPNPFWNATYLATRPFAIICFFETVKVLSEYEKDFQWKNCVLFAVSLLLTTMTKPSYTMVVVPLIGLILLIQLIVSRGKSFRNAFCLCVTMIPTGIALLYQFSGIFTGTNAMGEETGIAIGFAKVWSNYSKSIPLSIIMGMALPIGVLFLNLVFDFIPDSMMFVMALLIVCMCVFVFGYPKFHANQIIAAFFGVFYVAVMLSCIYETRSLEGGKYLVWLIFLCSWGCDTCAYCVGMLFGKHKMAPVLSPKKSVEGAVGGVIGAALLTIIYGFLFRGSMDVDVPYIFMMAGICAAGALISMVGDLAASAIKRNFEIKDYGKLIPGHGGILDRFDSVIFTAPIIYYLTLWLIK